MAIGAFNAHNKSEYPPMHTVEHVLNRAVDNILGCGRSTNAHIERKKSRMDFAVADEPTAAQVAAIVEEVNRVLASDQPVTYEQMTQEEAKELPVDLGRIPDNASDLVRVVRVGDYDICLCIGRHVQHTGQCGTFKLVSHSYDNGRWRIRFRLEGEDETTA